MKLNFWSAIAALISLGSIGTAQAADLPVKAKAPPPIAVYNWTGWYVGANGGGIWGHNGVSNNFFDGAAVAAAQTLAALAGNGSAKGSSWLAGVQAGYNWQ